MKFRFYITDTLNGRVRGTNDCGIAADLSKSDDYFVIDTEFGEWLMGETDAQEIQEF